MVEGVICMYSKSCLNYTFSKAAWRPSAWRVFPSDSNPPRLHAAEVSLSKKLNRCQLRGAALKLTLTSDLPAEAARQQKTSSEHHQSNFFLTDILCDVI